MSRLIVSSIATGVVDPTAWTAGVQVATAVSHCDVPHAA